MGRPTVLEALGLSVDDIVEAYQREGTLPKTADALKVSVNTCKKYLKLAKALGPQGGRPQPLAWRARRNSPVHEWFKEHRNEPIPRSVTAIAELSGFTFGQVKKFLFTRRRAALDYLRALGDLRELTGYLIDVNGRRIPYGMLASYELKLDSYDLTVRIHGVLRFGGEVRAVLTFRQYQEIFRDATAR